MRRRKAPERFFRAPPQEILDTIRELTLTNIEKRLDQFPERLNYFINAGDEEESKRKDIALQKDLVSLKEKLLKAANIEFDLFELFAHRNVFSIPDSVVFLDDEGEAEQTAQAQISEAIDPLLKDLLERAHLNTQLRQRITQMESLLLEMETKKKQLESSVSSLPPSLGSHMQRLMDLSTQITENQKETASQLKEQNVTLDRSSKEIPRTTSAPPATFPRQVDPSAIAGAADLLSLADSF